MDRNWPDWDAAYRNGQPESLSWFETEPGVSLDLIRKSGLPNTAGIVDAGAGSSPVLINLAQDGWRDLTAVDLSPTALAALADRIQADHSVKCVVADICIWRPDRQFDLWHDRAVLHFLTDSAAREAYVTTLKTVLKPGGFAVIGTFAPDGPDKCFGQPIRKYDAETLMALLGPEFHLIEQRRYTHVTPAGTEQRYFYGLVQRSG